MINDENSEIEKSETFNARRIKQNVHEYDIIHLLIDIQIG